VAVAYRLVVAASAGEARFFETVLVMGVVVCIWIAMICGLKGDRQGSTFHDPFNVAPHWRLVGGTGGALIVIGLLGLVVVAVMP
jgi:hypothetical protein